MLIYQMVIHVPLENPNMCRPPPRFDPLTSDFAARWRPVLALAEG